jgi:hypothetical protein
MTKSQTQRVISRALVLAVLIVGLLLVASRQNGYAYGNVCKPLCIAAYQTQFQADSICALEYIPIVGNPTQEQLTMYAACLESALQSCIASQAGCDCSTWGANCVQ